MSTPEILSLIDAEITLLKQTRDLLAATAPATGKRKPGRPPKVTAVPNIAPVAAPIAKPKKRKKRNLSPEGRARIAAAVKARWAAQKKAAK